MNDPAAQKAFHARADVARYRNRLDNPLLRPKEIRLARRLLDLLPADGGALLEVGCGEGNNLAYLKAVRPSLDCVGTDFSLAKVAHFARDEGVAPGVCADAAALPFRDGLFGLVLLRDLLHHVNWARAEVLAEACRVVRADGAVVVIESSPWTPLNLLFMVVVPEERGMLDSTDAKLRDQLRSYGEVRREASEASYLVRALSYIFGCPGGLGGVVLAPLFGAARGWEWLAERIVPKGWWTSRMLILRPAGTAEAEAGRERRP